MSLVEVFRTSPWNRQRVPLFSGMDSGNRVRNELTPGMAGNSAGNTRASRPTTSLEKSHDDLSFHYIELQILQIPYEYDLMEENVDETVDRQFRIHVDITGFRHGPQIVVEYKHAR